MIVVDTSALMAIVLGVPAAISSGTVAEVLIVAVTRASAQRIVGVRLERR